MTDLPVYVLERSFSAPRALVWRAWTEPALLARWYGPNVETVVHRLDPRPGGLGLIEMKWNGRSNFQRLAYTEVIPSERLAWLHANSDAEWNVTPSPMMPDWPRTLLTTVSLAEEGPRTRLRLTWVPHAASAAEIACFSAAIDRIGKGWDAGMALLAKLLAELRG